MFSAAPCQYRYAVEDNGRIAGSELFRDPKCSEIVINEILCPLGHFVRRKSPIYKGFQNEKSNIFSVLA